MLVEKHAEVYADALFLHLARQLFRFKWSHAKEAPKAKRLSAKHKKTQPNLFIYSIWRISASAELSVPLEVITFFI